ncbi:MAG: ATP-binding cassette domain-containing protein [Desulfosarcinaceae bacterium]|nr:ATP-binding cassette domain-containing protein [Desulfosarcinaceae bacterium]
MATHLEVNQLTKRFKLHILEGKEIVAFQDISFRIDRGRFLGISGKSGYGKSSLIKCIYRNYDITAGEIWLHDETGGRVDLTQISDIEMLAIRHRRMGYVSQFFQPIPRVTTMNVVIEPLIDKGWERERAMVRAKSLFQLFDIPANLWDAYPSTFSGGEKQRINLMRTLIDCPELLLLDEPTASLDRNNREIILSIIQELKRQQITMIGIFHNPDELALLSDEILSLERPGEEGNAANDNRLATAARFAFQVG